MYPTLLYEVLPYVYMLGGSISLIGVDNGWGKICGLVLIVAGVTIMQIRARYRSQERMSKNILKLQHNAKQPVKPLRPSPSSLLE